MAIGNAVSWDGYSSDVQVIIDGSSASTYYHHGTTYIEAIKGKRYSIRITNPLGVTVAVALSVDGLSTINAQHTDARQAPKWVLYPYQSMVITGWQVDNDHAREFYFTTEDQSYGAKLGKTQNLGQISAAFFKERRPVVIRRTPPPPPRPYPPYPPPYPPYPRPLNGMDSMGGGADIDSAGGGMGGFGGGARGGAPGAVPGSPPAVSKSSASRAPIEDSIRPSKPEYAATGIGSRVGHEVERVYLDLEDSPFQTVELRYEFRPALLKLGVLPSPPSDRDPLLRREKSKGFNDREYCPEP